MQQELRWLAIYTQDPALLEVFQKGLDMHSRVTCQIYGFDYDLFEQVRHYRADTAKETEDNIKKIVEKWRGTKEMEYVLSQFNTTHKTQITMEELTEYIPQIALMFELFRSRTKSVVFGTVYGITEIGLSDQLNISQEEAKQLIDSFKSGLPNYLKWEQSVHKQLMEQGYVETILGRKRRFGETIAEAKSSDLWKKRGWHWLIEKCKRQSTNVMIQGFKNFPISVLNKSTKFLNI